jgi:hypothetical protein
MGKDKQGTLGFSEMKQKKGPVECMGQEFEDDQARRDHYMALLAEKLEDPEFRETPGFPKGTDEAILRLSDPPYYTACPNPFLGEFVGHFGNDYEPDSEYSRKPLASDVREGKQDPVCMAHTYHTKVPYRAIVRYLLNYTDPGDLVLDCFAGTGMTGVAAQVAASPPSDLRASIAKQFAGTGEEPKWGPRKAILCDLSPFASFLACNFTSDLTAESFGTMTESLLRESESELGWVYETTHPDSGQIGEIGYALWTDVLICECSEEVHMWTPQFGDGSFDFDTITICPQCSRVVSKRSSQRAHATAWDDQLGQTVAQNRHDLVMIQAQFDDYVMAKPPDQADFELMTRIQSTPLPSAIPSHPMMFTEGRWGDMFRAGIHFGITHVHHFWTRRNLLVLGDLISRSRLSSHPHEMLFLCTSFAVKTGSRMHNVGFKGGRINLAGQTYNTLQFPSVSAERNLYVLARGKARDLRAAFEVPKSRSDVIVGTQSATSLAAVPDSSIDYVFIDPPFGDNIIYSELSFLYESLLGVFSNQESEAIVSSSQGKGVREYQNLMESAFGEIQRVLKPGRWVTVAFHNSKNAVWNSIQEALGRAGLVVADVRVLDKGQGTYKQMTTTGAVKQDLVISAYRPDIQTENRFELSAGTVAGVWEFVGNHLKQLPVFVAVDGQGEVLLERQNFLLFDRMVAFHVQRNVSIPLSASAFYSGVAQRFPSRDGMYFLPEQVAEYDRRRTTISEMRQLELFVSDEASAIQWVRQQLHSKPQSFQDLQPQFMQHLQSWAKHEKTVELKEILELNFLVYEGNGHIPSQIHSYLSSNFKDLRKLDKDAPLLKTKALDRWFVPDPKKEGDLEKLRLRTLLKEFEDYRNSTTRKIKQFRTEAVRAGFKNCYDEQDYQTIVDVAAKLPEKVIQEDEKLLMYYDVATMRLGE